MINPPAPNRLAAEVTQFYAVAGLLFSFYIGMAVVPGLLIEEKEKKTLRMLMVSPASWADVVAAKLLVAFCYQLLLSISALAIARGLTGQIPLVVLFVLLGSLLSVALGALAGCIFTSQSASGGVSGIAALLLILPPIFSDQFGLVGNNLLTPVVKVLPTYWLGDGILKSLQNQATLENMLLDAGIVLGSTLLIFLVSVWGLRRQASVISTI